MIFFSQKTQEGILDEISRSTVRTQLATYDELAALLLMLGRYVCDVLFKSVDRDGETVHAILSVYHAF